MDFLTALRPIMASQPGVVSAYLFGSRATGKARPDSDIDLAVDWDPALDAVGKAAAECELRTALAKELGAPGERADLVDLRCVGVTLGFRVIRDGKLLMSRNPKARVDLEARIARRYDDEAPYRRLFRRAAVSAGQRMEAMARGRF